MAALELLLERNAKAGRPFAAASWPKLCLITCDDAALTGQLEASLGLAAGDAVILRLPAGGGALSVELVERMVAKAVLVDGCDEVLVLSHSSCTLYNLSASKLIDAAQKAGVARSAIPMDLRELVGAGRDPRESVRQVAESLRRCAFLPESLLVHLGHLDESSGKLMVVEDGEQYRTARAQAGGSTNVAGYTAGPSKLGEQQPPATVLPTVANFNVQQISGPAMPEVRPFELQAISVTLPSVTQQMPVSVDMPAVTTQLASTVQVAGPELTARSMLGEAPSAMATPTVLTTEGLFGTSMQDPGRDRPQRKQGRQGKFSSAQPPAPKKAPRADAPPQLRPQLASAIEKVRIFMSNEIAKPERREVIDGLNAAMQEGLGSEDLVKIALKPVLQSGQSRYKIIDEMILVKDELTRMPPFQAVQLLRMMVP